jgi:hypothetical protein
MQKKATALLVSTGIAGVIAGGVLMGSLPANAADDSSGSSGTSTSSTADPGKPMRDDEKLLTGDALEKVTAAVKDEYPDATIQRVETDSDGVYEAHILDDGKPLTVKLDKSYAITGTESGRTDGRSGGKECDKDGNKDGDASDAERPAA